MRFVIDTQAKVVTVYGNPGLKELAAELLELSEKGFEGYSVHAVPLLKMARMEGTSGYVSTDTLTINTNEPVIPPVYL